MALPYFSKGDRSLRIERDFPAMASWRSAANLAKGAGSIRRTRSLRAAALSEVAACARAPAHGASPEDGASRAVSRLAHASIRRIEAQRACPIMRPGWSPDLDGAVLDLGLGQLVIYLRTHLRD